MQGVGFRPFVKRLADRMQLCGNVSNTAGGVVIEIETDQPTLDQFIEAMETGMPSAARIETRSVEPLEPAADYTGFAIVASSPGAGSFTLISPDLATCGECARETLDPTGRRYQYPFTNCTNCGPRYSIITTIPYDRPNTTMARFTMCAECAAEYRDPADRRFHAEPVACPRCGPQIRVEPAGGDALEAARAVLEGGLILAIKGIGGFQLACDALAARAVETLRERKKRSRKAFAVMMRDLEAVERYCHVADEERALLESAAAPIVLLRPRAGAEIPAAVAPGLRELGVMLPYTPLHRLLFTPRLECLVMTSGNLSEEPIVISNHVARRVLAPIADALVVHNRGIFMRVDDSVVRQWGGSPRVLRRARGYAPGPIDLGFDADGVLACGAELKNTFCLTRGNYAIPSQHIGNMENLETLEFFEETLRNLKNVYRAEPRLIARDLHPDYMTTRWAERQPLESIGIQHHHAHIASCMAENNLRGPVIGVAFDGTGYGTDGQIWGGEFLVGGYGGFRRAAHLRCVPLVGGDQAVREPYRMAAIQLVDAFGGQYRALDLPVWQAGSPAFWKNLELLFRKAPAMTSSCGRLFDAVAALAGICQRSSYEGEAAMLLEAAADAQPTLESAAMPVDCEQEPWTIDTRPLIREVARWCAQGRAAGAISAAFHESMALTIAEVCGKLRDATGIGRVCLSGGTFQNCTLLGRVVELLGAGGMEVFLHSKVPPNDGGISLGQAAMAAEYLRSRE